MKKILIPLLLGTVIAIAGIFAILPVQEATSVHTTILTTMPQQYVVVVSAGATALNEVPLISTGATGTEFTGSVSIMILDSSEAADAADVRVGCDLFANFDDVVDDTNAVDAQANFITALDGADSVGDAENDTMVAGDDCELVRVRDGFGYERPTETLTLGIGVARLGCDVPGV